MVLSLSGWQDCLVLFGPMQFYIPKYAKGKFCTCIISHLGQNFNYLIDLVPSLSFLLTVFILFEHCSVHHSRLQHESFKGLHYCYMNEGPWRMVVYKFDRILPLAQASEERSSTTTFGRKTFNNMFVGHQKDIIKLGF